MVRSHHLILGGAGVLPLLLFFSWFFWCSITQKNTEERHQKKTRSQKNTEHQKRETAAMSVAAVIQTEMINDFI